MREKERSPARKVVKHVRYELKNVRILDPVRRVDQVGSLFLEDGRMAAALSGEPDQAMDCAGLVAAPGLVDMHVHLRDPGQTHKEDLFTACKAAAAGGVTSLLAMPNTAPPMDSPELVRDLLARAREADATVYTAACVTRGMKGQELTDFAALKAAGAIALSDDGKPVGRSSCLLEALERAKELGLALTAHCEDLDLASGGLMNQGEVSRRLGLKGVPRAAEDCGVAREIAAAASLGARVHICHVSTRGSVALIREAKARGVAVTAETCPHYLLLTDQAMESMDADFRMNPPLGDEADRQALLEGLANGPRPPYAGGKGGLHHRAQRLHRYGDLPGRRADCPNGAAGPWPNHGENERQPSADSEHSRRKPGAGGAGRCGALRPGPEVDRGSGQAPRQKQKYPL